MRRTVLAAGLLLAALVNTVEAQLVVEITEGIKRRPVAVVPFAWEGNTPEMPTDVAEVIASDLERSGRFRTIPEADMLQKPTSGAEMDFDDWAILDVEAVVVGRVLQTAENAYSVQFQLFDVFGQRHVIKRRFEQRGEGGEVGRHDDDVARFERRVGGEDVKDRVAGDLDLAAGAVGDVDLDATVGGSGRRRA